MTTMYGFEYLTDNGQWVSYACGEQGPSNLFETREDAEEEIPLLAAVMECAKRRLRVVAFEV